MKLEVGKFYNSREGKLVEIVHAKGTESFPFHGREVGGYNTTHGYREDGTWSVSRSEHPIDLVSESERNTLTKDEVDKYLGKAMESSSHSQDLLDKIAGDFAKSVGVDCMSDHMDALQYALKGTTGGIKHDTEKARMDLLSGHWLLGVSDVLTFGAKKYDAHNWRKGLARSRLIAASLRHITAYNQGEDCDKETGLLHLYHASCCLMFASELHFTRPDLDDRYKDGAERNTQNTK